ncbi:hypothetical protein CI109_103231 [Kwoniella shandongensis]|uniref:Uncharacterized protein n=1 Tax=Kwoniella shandongensis TaxID=1734106 RepID=A0A5M6C8T4_9TREE|nr:uncharacterized protein CI109_000421 [Kwoniella shandongensis]KAA5531578.1 hypothetical protein CI109_000421 [Kwoniella shandongensis]
MSASASTSTMFSALHSPPLSPNDSNAKTALHYAITEGVFNLIQTCSPSSQPQSAHHRVPTSSSLLPQGVTLVESVIASDNEEEEEVQSETAASGGSSPLDEMSLVAEASTTTKMALPSPTVSTRGRSRTPSRLAPPAPVQLDVEHAASSSSSRRREVFRLQRGDLELKIGSWSNDVRSNATEGVTEGYPEIPETIPSPSIPYTYILRTSPPILGSPPAPLPSLTLYENLPPSSTTTTTPRDMGGLGLIFSPNCSTATFRPASKSFSTTTTTNEGAGGGRDRREWLMNLIAGGDWEDKKDIEERKILSSKVEIVEGMPTPRQVAVGSTFWG